MAWCQSILLGQVLLSPPREIDRKTREAPGALRVGPPGTPDFKVVKVIGMWSLLHRAYILQKETGATAP